MKSYNTLDLIEALDAIGQIVIDGNVVDGMNRYDGGWQLRCEAATTPTDSWAFPDQVIEVEEDRGTNSFLIKNSDGKALKFEIIVRRYLTTYDLDTHIAATFIQQT